MTTAIRCLILTVVLAVSGTAFAQHPTDTTTADKRKTCAEAMNADPSFALAIVETINQKTADEHRAAASRVAKNEKHVILAYAAMWLLAAGFVLFMWQRQQHLKSEIALLRRDLDAATKDDVK